MEYALSGCRIPAVWTTVPFLPSLHENPKGTDCFQPVRAFRGYNELLAKGNYLNFKSETTGKWSELKNKAGPTINLADKTSKSLEMTT